MILAVDIGNTRAKLGLFQQTDTALPAVVDITASPLLQPMDLAEVLSTWLLSATQQPLTTCVLAGSNPPVRDALRQLWPLAACPPVVIESSADVPLAVDVEQPLQVGIDRLLSALAARTCRQTTAPAVIVDSGTATTVDLLTSDGVFRGGSILPGLRLSAFALHDYTARLPLIDTDVRLTTEPSLPGRNTEQAMCAGLFWGQLGAVRELIARLSAAATEQFGETRPVELFITGGGGRQLLPHFSEARYIDSLALHGLAILAAEGAPRIPSIRTAEPS